MTTDLDGFNSTYYAGLNLVLCAANLLLPWGAVHSAVNSVVIIGLYVAMNLVFPNVEPVDNVALINNLYFLTSMAIITVSITFVKSRLVKQEFLARLELKAARDALWGEMEVAKRIQTALLPKVHRLDGYAVAATMLPANEVGGDYYDIVETAAGETWLSIGDVSGHGVESGLIMMMTRTSILTTVNHNGGYRPSRVLEVANSVFKQNAARLGTDRYMTLSAMLLDRDRIAFAGKHQDILIYRRAKGDTETVPTTGTWLGVVDDLTGRLTDREVPIEEGDIILLFTDGVTEAANESGEMFGEQSLVHALNRYADLEVDEIVKNIVRDVRGHMHTQTDDVSLVAIQRIAAACAAG